MANRQTRAYRKLNKSTRVVKGANVADGGALEFVDFPKGHQPSKRKSKWRGAKAAPQKRGED